MRSFSSSCGSGSVCLSVSLSALQGFQQHLLCAEEEEEEEKTFLTHFFFLSLSCATLKTGSVRGVQVLFPGPPSVPQAL